MTKNIIISIVVILLLVFGGYRLWGSKPSSESQDAVLNLLQATTTPLETTVAKSNLSQTGQAPTANTTVNKNTTHMITIETNYGNITIQTYDADAPNTVANFVKLASK